MDRRALHAAKVRQGESSQTHLRTAQPNHAGRRTVARSADVRRAVHETREDLGTVEARDLPVKDYDNLSGDSAIKAIKELDNAKDVRLVLRFEQAHQNRKGITTAAQQRMTDLAKQSVNA